MAALSVKNKKFIDLNQHAIAAHPQPTPGIKRMTVPLLFKLVLILLFIPVTYGVFWAAKRKLTPTNPLRQFLERHGVVKVAQLSLLAMYTLGGTWLAIRYS